MDAPEISVVVLAYRSAETISTFVDSLVDSLEKENLQWEIILVGNYFEGKGDQTPEVINKIASQEPRIKVVTKIKKGMMGWDMKTGLQAATGKSLAVIDGDGQMPSVDVVRVYQLMKQDGLDLIAELRKIKKFIQPSMDHIPVNDTDKFKQLLTTSFDKSKLFIYLITSIHHRPLRSYAYRQRYVLGVCLCIRMALNSPCFCVHYKP